MKRMVSKRGLAVIIAISLILVIVGASFGYYLGNKPATDDVLEGSDVIVLNTADIGELGVQSIDLTYSARGFENPVILETFTFNFEEFSTYTKQSIPSKSSLITYLTEHKYDMRIQSGGDEIFATQFKGCTHSELYNTNLCEFETVSYRDYDKRIIVENSKHKRLQDE